MTWSAGDEVREALAEEPGTYFLTDFLARTFERTVVRELGLDRYPELRDDYFGSYRRVVWLAQRPTPPRTPPLGRPRRASGFRSRSARSATVASSSSSSGWSHSSERCLPARATLPPRACLHPQKRRGCKRPGRVPQKPHQEVVVIRLTRRMLPVIATVVSASA